MKFTRRQQTYKQRGLLRAVVVALLLQSLFPSGYMPGSWSDGWVATRCPDGLPQGFVQQLAAKSANSHHHHHHMSSVDKPAGHALAMGGESGGQSGGDGHDNHAAGMGDCQLGSALDQPLDLASTSSVLFAQQLDAVVFVSRHARVVVSATSSVHARAPPIA